MVLALCLCFMCHSLEFVVLYSCCCSLIMYLGKVWINFLHLIHDSLVMQLCPACFLMLQNLTELLDQEKKGPAHWRDCGDISHVRKGHWFWEPQRDWGSAGRTFLLFAKWLGRVQAALSPCTHGWSRGLPYCGTKHSETLVILDKKETSLMVSNYTNIMQYFDYPGASV